MSRPFGSFNHVVRLALLFALGLAAFLVLRWWFVPSDFGVYGHYRAGALDDNRARAVVYAGQGACLECHADVVEVRQGGRHAGVRCEACHGPLGAHASGGSDVAPQLPDPRALCIGCHARSGGKPAGFPQVTVRDHAAEGACTACHTAHKPAVG
jgi:cytochrome c554/c'-like protein